MIRATLHFHCQFYCTSIFCPLHYTENSCVLKKFPHFRLLIIYLLNSLWSLELFLRLYHQQYILGRDVLCFPVVYLSVAHCPSINTYFTWCDIFLTPQFTPPTRLDCLVLLGSELSWWQSQTVFSTPQYIGDWTVSSSLVCGVNTFVN